MAKLRVAINGAAGRMGQRLIALGSQDPDLAIVAAIDAPTHPHIGQDAGLVAGIARLGVPLEGSLNEAPDVVIDFSVPEGAESITTACLAWLVPLVMATTGLGGQQQQLLKEASQSIAVLWSPSMSLTVNLAMKLAETAAKPGSLQLEIVAQHVQERCGGVDVDGVRLPVHPQTDIGHVLSSPSRSSHVMARLVRRIRLAWRARCASF